MRHAWVAFALLSAAAPGLGLADPSDEWDPPLERDLTGPERAWFGAPLVEVVAVMNAGRLQRKLPPCRPVSDSDDLGAPSSLVEKGQPSRRGTAPISWGIELTCGGHALSVTLLPAPWTPRKGDVVKVRRTGWTQLASGEVIVGEVAPEGAPTPATQDALARPVAVIVTLEGSLQWLDRDAVRGVLAKAPRSAPAAPRPIDVEPKGVEPAQTRGDELAAYAAVLRSWGTAAVGPGVVLSDVTEGRELSPTVAARILDKAPDLLPSALHAWMSVRDDHAPLPDALSGGSPPVVRLSAKELDGYFGPSASIDAGWQRFRADHGRARVGRFSRVGFSHDHSQAVVYAGWRAGSKTGMGELFFLVRSGSGYAVRYRLMLWVS